MTTSLPLDDPYLWLEEVEGKEALSWVREQSARTTDLLCDAAFARDQAALYEIATQPTNIAFITRRGDHVYNFWQDSDHVRGLWRRTTLESYRADEPDWDVLLDVDLLAEQEGEDWVWKASASCEPAHERALVTLSRGGADAAVIREFDLPSKQWVADGFVLPESKGSASWVDADTVLVSSTLGEDAVTECGYPRVVRRWRRGTPFDQAPLEFEGVASDIYVGGGQDRSPGYERLFFRRQITFEEGETYVGSTAADLVKLDLPLDCDADIDRQWLTVRLKTDWTPAERTYPADALLVIDADVFLQGDRAFTVLFDPKPRRVLTGFTWAATRLVLTVLDNLSSQILLATPAADGWTVRPLEGLPAGATLDVFLLDTGVMSRTDDFLVGVSYFLQPPSLGLVTADGGFEILKQAPESFDPSGLAVSRHEALATDGERIPYFQISQETATEPGPTVLYGYGGFNVSSMPQYLAGMGKVWLETGGTWVVANIRGGGEFGAAWHKAGMREGKKLSHDDFAAVARDLVLRGVTTPAQLAAYGGSNGGLLVGNMLTRYPDHFGAVWCTVPLLDMKRYTKLLAGASWVAEYGDPDVEEDWAFLRGHSAYQLVEPGRQYPPLLLVTSRRDDRVHPGHARKMAAKLTGLDSPVLFYEPGEGGHGAANKKQGAQLTALGISFLRAVLIRGEVPGGPKPSVG